MAVNNWLSRALARSQLDTAAAGGTWEAGDTVTATINGKSFTFTATTTTAAHMITGLLALLVASDIAEFDEIAWASPSSTTITGTSIAGVPFTLSVTRVTAGTGTFTSVTTTAATGPNHWNDINNWSAGTLPADTEDLNVDLTRGSIYYGLPQSSIEPATLLIYSRTSTRNTIGLPRLNVLGYTEYRSTKLLIGPAACTIDTDSPFIALDFGSDQVACDVLRAGQGDQVTPALQLCGSHASNTWEVVEGFVGFALYDDEVVAGESLKVNRDAKVICADGVAVTTVTSTGQLDFQGTATSLTSNEGLTVIRGASAFTNLTAEGGDIEYRSTGTVTNPTAGGRRGGTIDCSKDISPRTFTNTTIKRGGRILDPDRTITHTNKIAIDTSVSEVTAA